MVCLPFLCSGRDPMSTSQQISRGFHRLAILIAALPLLGGGSFALVNGFNQAGDASRDHQKVLCAHEYLARERDQPKPNYKLMFAPDSDRLNLKEIGRSNYERPGRQTPSVFTSAWLIASPLLDLICLWLSCHSVSPIKKTIGTEKQARCSAQ